MVCGLDIVNVDMKISSSVVKRMLSMAWRFNFNIKFYVKQLNLRNFRKTGADQAGTRHFLTVGVAWMAQDLGVRQFL